MSVSAAPDAAAVAAVLRSRRRRERLRTQVFDHYGWACSCCGSQERPSIDHIHGDGKRHREAIGISCSATQMYYWLVVNNFPDGFQVLCVLCNKSKGNRDRCILDHAVGAAVGMTSAERSRRWRVLRGSPVVNRRDICSVCGRRRRLRSDGMLESHFVGNERHLNCKGSGQPPKPFADLLGPEDPQ